MAERPKWLSIEHNNIICNGLVDTNTIIRDNITR